MTFRSWSQWPAEEPPPDFTDRMVGRLLEAEQAAPQPGRSRRRWIVVLAVAAVLAGTTAWAMMRHARPVVAPPAQPPVQSEVIAPPASTQSPRAAGSVPSAEPPVDKPPASTSSAARARPVPSASVAVPPASASAKRVVVPRCECGPGSFICTCVE